MPHVKESLPVGKTIAQTVPIEQPKKQHIADPAAEAGVLKNRFYQTDKWVVGRGDVKTYIVPKNTVPEPLLKAFMPSQKPDPVTNKLTFDRTKFELDGWPDHEFPGGRVAIGVFNPSRDIVDITFEKDTFVIRLVDLPKTGIFPFNKDEFLKAIHVAKWDLELYNMPKSDSDSDDELKKA